MGQVAHIWRHPIKSHGREEVTQTQLHAGHTMPGDRVWAVRHAASKIDGSGWAPCVNFSRGSKAPALMAIEAKLDEATRTVALSHPDRPDVTIQPDENPAAFLEWVHPLMPNDRAASAQILAAADRGMTDTDFPSISLINLSSHRAVAQKIGRDISPKRWRGNFWIEGLAPWEEFEWIGREMRIGSARVVLRDRIVRCMATTASPSTGKRDADTLAALDAGWGHQDFGVYAEVTQSGTVVQGDRLVLI